MALAISSFAESLGAGVIVAGLLLALGMATVLALAVGAIALRLRGAYFAIATIGVNEGVRYLIEGARLWGGSEGIIISRPLREAFGPEGANLLSTFWADTLVYLIAMLAAFITVQYLHSKIGYALMALREDEDAAKVMGVHTTKYKIIAFITSAALGGLLGATGWVLKLTYVFPADVFAVHYTVEAIVIVLLGGAGTLLGPLAGGMIYAALKYWLSISFPGLQLLLLAPIILFIVVAFPQGLIGVLKAKAKGTFWERVIV
jgi:branched-chain amino acid transport system permease protein